MSPFLRGMTGQQMGVGMGAGTMSPAERRLMILSAPSVGQQPAQQAGVGPRVQAPLDIAGLRRQVLAQSAAPTAPQSRQALMAKYGLAPTAPAPKPSPMQLLSSAMPASGTPQMAGLGAAGRAMLEMSGYQPAAQAPSIGQILARSAEAGIGAMEKRKAAEQAAAEKKAAAERQARLDELQRRNVESQIAAREKEEKTAKALNFKSTAVIDPETGQRGKADVAFLPLGSPLIEALGGDPTTGRVVRKDSFVPDKPDSESNIRTVTGVGVVDFSDRENPKILMESEDPRRFTNLGPYRKGGKSIGEGTLDRHTGERFITQADGTRIPIPDDAIPVTEGMAAMGIPNFGQFKNIREELNADEVSMRNYASYLKNIESADSGVGRLADDFSAYIKTFLSTNAKELNLSEEELALRIAQGQMQGLLGSARIETVGGGVMTEQDALRVIENIGGNVDALQSKQVVKGQITRMFAQKYNKYEKNIHDYNNAVENLYSDRGYERKSPIEVDARLFDPKIMAEMGLEDMVDTEDSETETSDALSEALGQY